MRLTRIDITNTLGIRRLAVDLAAPVLLVAGKNGAGKTSLLQCICYALSGEMPRVSLKKDGHQLVTEGAKTGSIAVQWDGGEAEIALPDCKLIAGKAVDTPPAMPLLTDMHAFARLPDNDRRAFLFGLTGTKVTGDEVQKRLLDRKADPKKIDAVLPLLRSGFPAAHKEAAGRATEAKGAWRGVTGETYGSKKAEGWKAPLPSPEMQINPGGAEGSRNKLAALNADLDAENKALGGIEAQQKAAAADAARIAGLRQAAGQVDRITAKLEHDRKSRDELKAVVDDARRHKEGRTSPLSCPDCGALLTLDHNGQLAVFTREPGDDTGAEVGDRLPEYEKSLNLLNSAVANDERDLATARSAAAQLAEIDKAAAGQLATSAEDIEARKVLIADIKAQIAKTQTELSVYEAAQRTIAEADGKTRKAGEYHADVAAWELIADALAPDGIPGELLAQALQPINTLLAQSAADTGWPQVTVDAEMAIRAAGRPYALLSESEQWRCDAVLVAAIANLSGVRLALFDRLDVLDTPSRGVALGWFDTLAEANEIDTLIVAGTLKALPSSLPDSYQAIWIESGTVAEPIKEAA